MPDRVELDLEEDVFGSGQVDGVVEVFVIALRAPVQDEAKDHGAESKAA